MRDQMDVENVHTSMQAVDSLPRQHIPSTPTSSILVRLIIAILMVFVIWEPFIILLLKGILAGVLLCAAIGLPYLFAERRAIRRYANVVQKIQAEHKNIYVALFTSKSIDADSPVIAPSEEQDVEQLLQNQNEHLLLLGMPGAGKTVSLKSHQYNASRLTASGVRSSSKIPILIEMKSYNNFLNRNFASEPPDSVNIDAIEQLPLLGYLATGEITETKQIRRHLKKWMKQGRLQLLCEGLNEIHVFYLPLLCSELAYIMHQTTNRVVMTCRELDYNEHEPILRQLVQEKCAHKKYLRPLRPEQVTTFIANYVTELESAGEPAKYSAAQIAGIIKNTRLQYECTNPLMLETFIKTINSDEIETSTSIDTRGKLLRASIASLIERELKKERWQNRQFTHEDIVTLYSQVAYIARRRRKDSRNALPLGTGGTKKQSYRDLASGLDRLLAEPRGEGSTIGPHEPIWKQGFSLLELAEMLEFAKQADIISFNSGYLLSFRHELIAEYFVAEYLHTAFEKLGRKQMPFGVELIQNVSDWNEPIHNWAGLIDDPSVLENLFAWIGLHHREYGFNALTLALYCLGLKIGTVEDQARQRYDLTKQTGTLFMQHADTEEKQKRLAKTINECAQEGGVGVYRAFLPLLSASNIDRVILKLNPEVVPQLLFEHLRA